MTRFACVIALAFLIAELPVFAQESAGPGPTSTSTQPRGMSPTTGSAKTTDPTPGSSGTAQTANMARTYRSKAEHSPATEVPGPRKLSNVRSNVESALEKDSVLAGHHVNVQMKNKNEIVLSGTVASEQQKDHAEKIAMDTAGSRYKVRDNLKISGNSASRD